MTFDYVQNNRINCKNLLAFFIKGIILLNVLGQLKAITLEAL